jgi:Tat protein secretion system quality control protein TatD with DNase activity
MDMKDFDHDREEIVETFFKSGFSKLVTAADPYEPGSFEKTREILSYHENIFCMAAAHPHNADHYNAEIKKISVTELNTAVNKNFDYFAPNPFSKR